MCHFMPIWRYAMLTLVGLLLTPAIPGQATITRSVAIVLDPTCSRAKLLAQVPVNTTACPDVLTAITVRKYGIVVADATPDALKVLAAHPQTVTTFTRRGGWLMLWGVTPAGLTDFNRVVGVQHLLRPFAMEEMHLPSPPNPLLTGLDRDCVLMMSTRVGMNGCPLRESDVWSYVLDDDDIAPFSAYPSSDYWGGIDAQPGSDRFAPNLTNGFVDSWQLGFTFSATDPKYLTWTFTFPRAETLTSFDLTPDQLYRKITKIRLTFINSTAKPIELTVAQDVLARQRFTLPAIQATGIKLEILQTLPDTGPVTGIRNVWILVKRSPAFHAHVKPLLSLGVLNKYTMGRGGILVNEMSVTDGVITEVNRLKLQLILETLLRNVGACMTNACH